MLKQKETKAINHFERLKHQSWCLKNDYKIYLKPVSANQGIIVIETKGVPEFGMHKYRQKKLRIKDEKWWEIIFKLYTKIYKENYEK